MEENDWMGIWRSRSIVIDPLTNLYRDIQDALHGWCVIVPPGDFSGRDVCLPGLKFKMPFSVGICPFLVQGLLFPFQGFLFARHVLSSAYTFLF